MPTGADKYESMTSLYADPLNIRGTTYAKRWKEQEPLFQQTLEEYTGIEPIYKTRKIVCAIHGGGIEKGTSEMALACAGYHPATLAPVDSNTQYAYWLFEGLLSSGNGDLHVTASNYDEPVATGLIQRSKRCLSLHGCLDTQAPNLAIQVGGLDAEFRNILVEELLASNILAEVTTDEMLDGDLLDNICNKTTIGGCGQLEIPTSIRNSWYSTNTRAERKNTTTSAFWNFCGALRRALERVN